MKPRIKICCISSVEEAQMAASFGAAALGLVGRMPSGPGPIADELIAMIIRHKKSLPIKTIYNDVKKSLNKNACQTLFKKNTFSIVQYCSLLNISLATFKRAE